MDITWFSVNIEENLDFLNVQNPILEQCDWSFWEKYKLLLAIATTPFHLLAKPDILKTELMFCYSMSCVPFLIKIIFW
jgi:hypothetical protein